MAKAGSTGEACHSLGNAMLLAKPGSLPLQRKRALPHRRGLDKHVAAGGPEQQALKGGQLVDWDGARHEPQLHRLGLKGQRRLQQRRADVGAAGNAWTGEAGRRQEARGWVRRLGEAGRAATRR